MIKYILLWLAVVTTTGATSCLMAQSSVDRRVIGSSGGSATVGSGANAIEISFTVGEVSVGSFSAGTTAITAGFQQPVEGIREPNVVNPEGFIYGADCSTFRGWAWDRSKPNAAITVDILDGTNVIATLPADVFRQDLLDAGKGNGKHAFLFSIPETLKDGRLHSLSARVSNNGYLLKGSPKAIRCQPALPPINRAPQAPVSIPPLVAQAGVSFSSGALAVFTDPEGGALTYSLLGLPNGLHFSADRRTITGTPTTAGNVELTYSATDAGGLTSMVTFMLTVNAASTTVTGNFEGFLDKVECETIRGWAWDRNKPNAPVTVEFYTDNTVWGSVSANIYRVDLKTSGKGNGAHAYSFAVPVPLKGTGSHRIYARVQGSKYVLKDSGKSLNCPSPNRVSAEQTEELQAVLLENPVASQVSVEVRRAEGQPLRFTLTDLKGHVITERQVNPALSVERQSFSVLKVAPGFLLLRIQSEHGLVTLKVLKQ